MGCSDQNSEDLLDKMFLNGIPVANEDLADKFVDMFERKIKEKYL